MFCLLQLQFHLLRSQEAPGEDPGREARLTANQRRRDPTSHRCAAAAAAASAEKINTADPQEGGIHMREGSTRREGS